MNCQQIYDKVKAHLLKQGWRSLTENGQSCAYRGAEGRMCAAGVLIPDEEYDPAMEGLAAYKLPIVEALLRAGVIPSVDSEERHLVRKLQIIHDTYLPSEWEQRLEDLAHRVGLVP